MRSQNLVIDLLCQAREFFSSTLNFTINHTFNVDLLVSDYCYSHLILITTTKPMHHILGNKLNKATQVQLFNFIVTRLSFVI